MQLFKKILIANRGEIAARIIKVAQGLGIIAVAIFAEDDKDSLHVTLADEAFSLGDGNITETYLNIPKIIEIAVTSKCAAVHPGYGFLSENHLFAKSCQKNNLTFIGPPAKVVQLMGDKTKARELVKNMGFPVLDGFEGSLEELNALEGLTFPLMIKPTLGGGGKGMYIVHNQSELVEKVKSASREAGNYFSDNRVYFETYIEFAKHIEVQIIGDNTGNIVHLFDRECTIQRNFQKIIEEAPSPSIDEKLRNEITSAAALISKAVNYTNAGTVEFLLDEKSNWYFIEMNTRIQVEHPVTEAITGIDLIKLQIQVAAGYPLPFAQEDILMKGHAIELRVNAEDTLHHFRPSSGNISLFRYPDSCRFDTFIPGPYQLTPNYDSLLGKLIVTGSNRNEACFKALQLLEQVHIHGVETNISFLKMILENERFTKNQLYTRFCNDILPDYIREKLVQRSNQPMAVPIIAFVYLNFQKISPESKTIWNTIGYWRTIQKIQVKFHAEVFDVGFRKTSTHWFYDISGVEHAVQIKQKDQECIIMNLNEHFYNVFCSSTADGKTCLELNGFQYIMESPDLLRTASLPKKNNEIVDIQLNGHIRAPLHGRVVKINVLENAKINRGDVLLVIESMKTENHIVAPHSGFIKTIHVSEGNQVKDNMLLIELEYFNV
jgi:acetyl/propionyl-CoA carboxylase alpha subunit